MKVIKGSDILALGDAMASIKRLADMPERMARAVRAGCTAGDIHLTCTFPECRCKQTPVIVKAAVLAWEAPAARDHDELSRKELDEMTKRIHPDEMPQPDDLINYSGGVVGPVMFHYAVSEGSFEIYSDIAKEHGFEITGRHLSEDDPLYADYEQGVDILQRWQPKAPMGWQFAGKHDTEDGPYAFFMRRLRDAA